MSELIIVSRINDYLSLGGLFNPEFMEHKKVSLLIQDCRTEIEKLQKENEILRLVVEKLKVSNEFYGLESNWYSDRFINSKDIEKELVGNFAYYSNGKLARATKKEVEEIEKGLGK